MSKKVSGQWALIVILSAIAVVIVPLIVVWGILNLPFELRLIATVALIIVWGIVSGYKDWVISEREKEEKSPADEE